eukprot:NODE_13_length_54415_cov_0.522424.p11 type:complete len:437 gc:universal NODE_13_length_54415_cov_0.522424:36241-34931(-)
MSKPLIIDFGTGTCQAGFGKESTLDFVNVNEKRDDGIYVGSDCNIRARSAFDREFLTSHGAFDNALEYIFTNLDLADAPSIAISEALCVPYGCRSISNEILFECYNIPKVSYFVDSLAAFYAFSKKSSKSVLIDFGNLSTRVLAINSTKNSFSVDFEASKTIPFGKNDAVDLLLKTLQLKYPSFPIVMPKFDAEDMFLRQATVAENYDDILRELAIPSNLKNHNFTKQYPFHAEESLTEEEILAQKDKQNANRKRLREMNLNKRREKLENFRMQHMQLTNFLETLNNLKKSERLRLLKENNYKTVDDVEEFAKGVEIQIEKLEASVAKTENLMNAMDVDQADNEASKDEISEEYIEELKLRRKLLLDQLEVRKLDTTRRSASSNNRMREMAKIIDQSNKEPSVGDNFGMNDADWNVYHDIVYLTNLENTIGARLRY